MEVKQTRHLGLTPPDRGSDLRLGNPRSGRLPHSTDQLGARLRDPIVGLACNLCQTARHSLSIATAIRTQLPQGADDSFWVRPRAWLLGATLDVDDARKWSHFDAVAYLPAVAHDPELMIMRVESLSAMRHPQPSWPACGAPLPPTLMVAGSAGGSHHGHMRLTTMTQITVDGVMQGNGHATPEELESGFTRDGWALGVFADDTVEMITETYQRADAFLFGRRTYEMFADTWGTRPEMRSHPIGVALNGAHKYVVSSALERPAWGPATLLAGDPIPAIRELKRSSAGEIQVHGSATLVRSLFAAGLIDEMTLLVVPVVLGQGMRLFPDHGPDAALEVVRSHTDAKGVGVHVYRPAGIPEYHPARPN